jgi:hypothetical protein
MTTNLRSSNAQRVGEWLARACRRIARLDKQFARWLTGCGLPDSLAVTLIWIIRITVIGVALYNSIFLASILAGVVLLMIVGPQADLSDDGAPKWRDGIDGHGLYCDEQRVDRVPDDRHIN